MSASITPMASLKAASEKERNDAEAVHKLKLQWMMAKNVEERRRISEQIRKLLNTPGQA